MGKKKLALVDVDGVVLDLMSAVKRAVAGRLDIDLRRPMIHDGLEPDVYEALQSFLQDEDPYRHVDPLPDAIWGLEELDARGYTVFFNTAIMKSARGSYKSKHDRLASLIGDRFKFEYAALPSAYKHYVRGSIGVDDRSDICYNYARRGVRPFLIARQWSFGGTEATKTMRAALDSLNSVPGVVGAICWDGDDRELLNMDEISGGFKLPETDYKTAWSGLIAALDFYDERPNPIVPIAHYDDCKDLDVQDR